MLHVGISYSFEKKKRLFIVDYIKPSPVYQVKCKLVILLITAFFLFIKSNGRCREDVFKVKGQFLIYVYLRVSTGWHNSYKDLLILGK